MTAINMFVQPKARAGYIVSDGAITKPSGEMEANTPKVIYGVKGFPWAIGITGNVSPATILRTLGAVSPLTLKQLEKRLPSALRAAVAETAERYGMPVSDVIAMVKGVHWDFARKRPKGFIMQTFRGGVVGQDVQPFVWYELPWAAGTHLPPNEALGRQVDLTDPDSFDPERDGLKLIVEQRLRAQVDLTPGCDPGHCRIGGDVDLTVVTKRGVQVWKIHEFPDVVGQHIRRDDIGNIGSETSPDLISEPVV